MVVKFSEELCKRGVWLHPFHNNFLCAAHSPTDIAKTLEAADAAFAAVAAMSKPKSCCKA